MHLRECVSSCIAWIAHLRGKWLMDFSRTHRRSLSERRRSWSRTMELSDKDLVAGDDVDE